MGSRYLMGIDLGGGGGRCLVVDAETGAAAVSTRAWTHTRVPEYWPWAFDLDVNFVWRAVGELSREALQRAGIGPEEVATIGVASMRHAMVVVDGVGASLFATPTMDARAGIVALQLGTERGEEIYQRTGRWPNPILGAVRLLWLAEHQPDVLARAHTMLGLSDWLGYKLTGVLAVERTLAVETMVLDLHHRAWADDLIALLGLPRQLFPGLVDAGTRIGDLSDRAAAHLGLTPGTLVIAAGTDTQCALLGTGVVAPGQFGVVAGTTASVMAISDQPMIDPHRRLWTGMHVVPGLYVLESNAGAMGRTLDWLARAWYSDAPDAVAALCADAAGSPPGARGVLSTAGAHVFDATSLSLPTDTLTFAATSSTGDSAGRAAMARAVLEGMAYAIRANVEQIERISGQRPESLRLAGGMARSAVWSQMVSDVLDCPVHVAATTDAAALGAAICAGVGAGLYRDLVTGVERLARFTRSYMPDRASAEPYRSRYSAWRTALEKRADSDIDAAQVIVGEIMQQPVAEHTQADATFRPRIYVSAEVDEASLNRLRALGDVTFASYRRESRLLVGEDLWETLAGYHVFVTEVDIVDAEVLQKLPDLRAIVVCRGDPVNIDVAACTVAGVPVINTPGRNADAVADLTLAFMLMLARKLPEATEFLRQPGGEAGDMGRMGMAHERFQGSELWGRTVGLVGAGAVGRRVIQRLRPFGAHILVSDPFVSAEQAALLGAEKVELDDLLSRSDLVSLHAPVADETRGLIDAGALARMKDGAFLINTARAALVDDAALAGALASGKLGGAALDVFAAEPPGADDSLLAFPNVIATPHIGGNTHEVAAHQGEIVVESVERLLTGGKPDHVLNPESLEEFCWTGKRRGSPEALQSLTHRPGPGVTDLQVEGPKEQPHAAEPPAQRGGLLGRLARRIRGETLASTQAAPDRGAAADKTGAPAEPRDVVEAAMRRILARFTAAVVADPGMAAFAQGKDVTMLFTLRDMAQDFYLSFVDGHVAAGLGQSPQPSNVHLKMKAAILDGIFTGKVNGMRAAMTGQLSFSGDTNKAMAFQRLQGDLSRLYQLAREAEGDPGDLMGLSIAPTAAAPAETATRSEARAVSAAGAGDVREEILKAVRDLYTKGIITGTGGNVSARLEGNPNEVWITPSAIFKGDLRPDMLVRIDLDGNVLSDNGYSASSERHVHCALYRSRPEVAAVIHSHAPQATLMALTGTPFLPISGEAAFLGDIPVVPFIRPGSRELGEAVARAIGPKGVAVLMQNHGLVVAGSSIRRAADMTDAVETTAERLITCKLLGVEPPVLPDDVVAELRELGAMIA